MVGFISTIHDVARYNSCHFTFVKRGGRALGILNAYTIAATVLFAIGLYCLASKRNLVKLVMGIEIVTTAVNLSFMGMGMRESGPDPLAQAYVAINMAIGAVVIALALSFLVIVYRHYGSLDAYKVSRLRW